MNFLYACKSEIGDGFCISSNKEIKTSDKLLITYLNNHSQIVEVHHVIKHANEDEKYHIFLNDFIKPAPFVIDAKTSDYEIVDYIKSVTPIKFPIVGLDVII